MPGITGRLDIGEYRSQQPQYGFLQLYVQMGLDFIHQHDSRHIEIKRPLCLLLHPEMSKILEEKFTRYKQLVGKANLTDDDFEEIAELEMFLNEIPDYLALNITTDF